MIRKALPKVVLLATIFSYAYTYTNSLADCKTVARLFKNTCTQAPDSAATWFTNFQATYVSCTAMSSCPGGYGSPYNCYWPRKLCVSCSTSSSTGKVYMRIQTNTLPAQCSVTLGTPPELTLDYQILWNPSVAKTTTNPFTSQSNFDSTACSMTKTATVPSTSSFTNLNTTGYSSSNDQVTSGIMLDGVPIFSSVSGELVDPFYPQYWSGATTLTPTIEDVDACLAHPGGGVYHYHMMTPCIVSTAVDNTKSCSGITACASDVKTYAMDYFNANKTFTVLGLAKDGHLIIGPYATNGTMYDCKYMDQCGGIFLDDGSYAYVLRGSYPYTMNCFGPSGTSKYEASCTTNTCAAYSYISSSATTYFDAGTTSFAINILYSSLIKALVTIISLYLVN